MANVLAVAKQHTIIVLARIGRSQRQIAEELDIDRGTVKRYVDRKLAGEPPESTSDPNAAISIAGSDEAKPAISIAGSAGRQSKCRSHEEAIKAGLDRGLSGERIWQELRADHGFEGSSQSVRRFVRKLLSATPIPFRRMECNPGEEAQIDFGTGAPIVTSDGKRRKTHVFRMVLSHSRKGYSEVVLRQSTEDFIRAIENGLHHFRGVPKTLVVDNLKAAVIKADYYDPDLNPKIRAFADHYGTVILPTKSYTPRHKGKVERGVGYVQDNALKGKTFSSLQEQNDYLLKWEGSIADTRIHGTTRKQVKKSFEEIELSALMALPVDRFPFFREVERKVNLDGHVEVDKGYYSVPPEFLTRKVWVRWDARTVRIFDRRMKQIAFHVKHGLGKFSTQNQHIPLQKQSGVEKGATYLLGKTSLIGHETALWAEEMIRDRGREGVRVLQGLLNLCGHHSGDVIENACEIARTHGSYRLKAIRQLIKRKGDRQQMFEFINEHDLIRPLTEYGAFVHEAFQQTTANLKEQNV